MADKFTIRVISNSCGILPHTLRIWEQRYGAFRPERSESGQRLYSAADLKKANLLAELTRQGHTISQLADQSVENLEQLLNMSEDPKSQLKSKSYTSTLLKPLADYDLRQVAEELQHLRVCLGAEEFIFDVSLPTLREIGNLVAGGKYSVTQEHIISTLLREQLAQIYLPNIGDPNNQVALATPDGNLHELGILIAEILCRNAKVPTRYLGASHPAPCLAEALNAMNCHYLLLGAVSSDDWNFEEQISPYLQELDKHLSQPLTLFLGGGSVGEFGPFKNIQEVNIFRSFENLSAWLKTK